MVKLTDIEHRILENAKVANNHGQWYEAGTDTRKQAMEVLGSHGFVKQVTHLLFDITPAGRAWLAEKENKREQDK